MLAAALLAGCAAPGDDAASSSPEQAVTAAAMEPSVIAASASASPPTASPPTAPPPTALPPTAPVPARPTVADATPGDTSEPAPSTGPGAVTPDDLVRFVAAMEAAIAGTPDAGVVEEQPETYIALAQWACVRFAGGESFDTVAADLLADLSDSGASERLVGAVLGAATRTVCPEHAAVVPVG